MVSASDPAGIAKAMQNLGYRATLEKDSEGDPIIRSAATGTNFSVWFYGCDDDNGDCTGINFSTGFDLEDGATMETINTWNRDRLVGYSYLDDESDPYLQFFVVTNGGISQDALASILARWETSVADFKLHIGF